MLSLPIVLLLLCPPQQPSTIVVDWDMRPGANFPTVTLALANMVLLPGDTILVRGLKRAGFPAAYAQSNPDGTLTAMETFPLDIPEGVTVAPDPGGSPLYFWSDGTTTPSSLFRLPDSTGNSVTTLRNFTLGGGKIGVKVEPSFTTDEAMTVLLESLTFSGNVRAVSVKATTTGQIDIAVRNCKLQNLSFNPSDFVVPPVLSTPSVGLAFHATGGYFLNGPGIVNAEVLNLTTVGATQPTSPVNWLIGFNDLEGSLSGASRIIEVYSEGDGNSIEHSDPVQIPAISEVNLQVLGSNLDGKATSNQPGWDIGIYSASFAGTNTYFGDYTTGYKVLVSGSQIQNCNIAGVYATVLNDTRGRVEIVNSTVSQIGVFSTVGGITGNGIHMHALEGYLALIGSMVSARDNARAGAFLDCTGSFLQKTHWPVGLFLGLEDSSFYDNQANGIEVAGPNSGLGGNPSQSGIVGGTWDQSITGGPSLVKDSTKPFGSFEYGPGYINRCQIYDNSLNGVHVILGPIGGGIGSLAHFELVNSFLWGNGQRGFLAESATADAEFNMNFLTPITQCTIAHNGGTAYTNIAYEGIPTTNYSFFRYNEPAPGGSDPINRILNTIFERENSSDEDFTLDTRLLCVDDDPLNLPEKYEIGVGGIRAIWVSQGPTLPPFDKSTDTITPFAGIADQTLTGVNWYFLDSNPSAPNYSFFVDNTPLSYSLVEILSNLDYLLSMRPAGDSGDRDKGAHEVKP